MGFPCGSAGKESACKNLSCNLQDTWVQSLGWEGPLEKRKATHSSILAWRIPWTIQSMGMQRVRHDWVTSLQSHATIVFCINLTYILNFRSYYYSIETVFIYTLLYLHEFLVSLPSYISGYSFEIIFFLSEKLLLVVFHLVWVC